MKFSKCVICITLLLLLLQILSGCMVNDTKEYINVTQFGVLPANSGRENSQNLQKMIDQLSADGGTLYIPAGEYEFAENGTQTIGSHCVKMRSNVNIIGDGTSTILKPVGSSQYGLDMFYFNEYLDRNLAVYLENCTFKGFVIDAVGTSCQTYTSAGKGFMLNLVKNCHWENVIVRNTDATGFGMDCPIDCTISQCLAVNCGKAATWDNGGASGFGIGFGYSEDENLHMSDCEAYDNRKFGIFFEHQGRFDESRYQSEQTGTFTVNSCTAAGNYANFGGIHSMNVVYDNCRSKDALQHGFFFENALNSKTVNCTSTNDALASYTVVMTETQRGIRNTRNFVLDGCTSTNTKTGVKAVNNISDCAMSEITIQCCSFLQLETTISISGRMDHVTVINNHSEGQNNHFDPDIENFVHTGNSWN